MKIIKGIVSLMAFIAASNMCAAVPSAVQSRIDAIINKVKNDPNVMLSAPEKTMLNKYIPMARKDAWVQENIVDALDQAGFDMDQLKKSTPAKKTAAKKPAAKTSSRRTATKKPATQAPAKRTATRKPAAQAPAKRNSGRQPAAKNGSQGRGGDGSRKSWSSLPGATGPDVYEQEAYVFYDPQTKTLNEDGIREYMKKVQQENPTINSEQLIQKTYDYIAAMLTRVRSIMPVTQKGRELYKSLCDELMRIIRAEELKSFFDL